MTKPIDWSQDPPAHARRTTYEIIRCPIGGTGPWLITCPKHIGCQTYWAHGRTTPHLSEGCPGCAEDIPHRWNGWLCVYDERRLRHAILEITPGCLASINEFLLQVGTLRGARIRLFRSNGKRNGRLQAEVMKSELTLTQIPEPFDLQAELTRLWEAPSKNNRPKLETPRVDSQERHERKAPPLPDDERIAAEEQAEAERLRKIAEHQALSRRDAERAEMTLEQARTSLPDGATATDISRMGFKRAVAESLMKEAKAAKGKATKAAKPNGPK